MDIFLNCCANFLGDLETGYNMFNFNSANPKYMLKLDLVRFGLARFNSPGILRICLVQIYKKRNRTIPLDHNVKDDP